jgi:metallo-beta-lactamase class B
MLVLLTGCSSGGESPTDEIVPTTQVESTIAESEPASEPEPTLEPEPTPEPSPELPPWVVVHMIDVDLPSIITAFVSENQGIASDTGGGIYLTWDGGETWDQIPDNAPEPVSLEYVDENLVWYIGFGGVVMRSLDGGYTWDSVGALPYGGHNEFASFVDDTTGWIATTEMRKYWVTRDGAETWTDYPLPEGMGTPAAMHLQTDQDAYFLDLAGNLFITSDGGESWEAGSIGLKAGWTIPTLPHMAALRFFDQDHGLITLNMLGGGESRVMALRTEDGGATWTEEELPVPMGSFYLTRDGVYLTHIDVIDHSFFTVLRSTVMSIGASLRINEDLSVRMIQDGAYVFAHAFPWRANSLAVVMGDHLVLVDTPWTPQATEEILAWLEEQVGQKQVIAINTHFHLDNLGGNAYLVEQGIPVYGSEMTVQLVAERGPAMLAQTVEWMWDNEDPRYAEAFADFELVPPTDLFDINVGLELTFDGETLQVYYPGPAHAPDNVVVYFPERKLLFGGCMIIGWDAVGNTSDADLDAWPDSVRNLEQFDFEILVPGHGERLDPGLIEHTLNLLAGLP